MAWTSPITWVTGQVVTAAQLNTYLRDNTRYLHGDDGEVILSNALTLPNATAFQMKDSGGTSREVLRLDASNNLLFRVAGGSQLRVISQGGTEVMNITEAGVISFISPFRPHRHPYANERHIESGNVSVTSLANGTDGDNAVTFSNAYSSVNVVTSLINFSVGNPQLWACAALSITGAGFTLRIRNASGSTGNASASWIAEGQD